MAAEADDGTPWCSCGKHRLTPLKKESLREAWAEEEGEKWASTPGWSVPQLLLFLMEVMAGQAFGFAALLGEDWRRHYYSHAIGARCPLGARSVPARCPHGARYGSH